LDSIRKHMHKNTRAVIDHLEGLPVGTTIDQNRVAFAVQLEGISVSGSAAKGILTDLMRIGKWADMGKATPGGCRLFKKLPVEAPEVLPLAPNPADTLRETLADSDVRQAMAAFADTFISRLEERAVKIAGLETKCGSLVERNGHLAALVRRAAELLAKEDSDSCFRWEERVPLLVELKAVL
jgi:hypothetical protein